MKSGLFDRLGGSNKPSFKKLPLAWTEANLSANCSGIAVKSLSQIPISVNPAIAKEWSEFILLFPWTSKLMAFETPSMRELFAKSSELISLSKSITKIFFFEQIGGWKKINFLFVAGSWGMFGFFVQRKTYYFFWTMRNNLCHGRRAWLHFFSFLSRQFFFFLFFFWFFFLARRRLRQCCFGMKFIYLRIYS